MAEVYGKERLRRLHDHAHVVHIPYGGPLRDLRFLYLAHDFQKRVVITAQNRPFRVQRIPFFCGERRPEITEFLELPARYGVKLPLKRIDFPSFCRVDSADNGHRRQRSLFQKISSA